MTRQTQTDRAEEQRTDHRTASIGGDEQTQIQRLTVYLFHEHRLHDSAKDGVQEIGCHDHDDDCQQQLIVGDEPQSLVQFVEVLSAGRLFLLMHRLVNLDGDGDDCRVTVFSYLALC